MTTLNKERVLGAQTFHLDLFEAGETITLLTSPMPMAASVVIRSLPTQLEITAIVVDGRGSANRNDLWLGPGATMRIVLRNTGQILRGGDAFLFLQFMSRTAPSPEIDITQQHIDRLQALIDQVPTVAPISLQTLHDALNQALADLRASIRP